MNKWWTYQRERFPVLAHGLLIAAFSFSGVSYSALLRGARTAPPAISCLVAFGTSFLFFLELRIADEFKDFEEDSRWRPYRPVPRGLVTLRELGWAGGIAGFLQLVLALLLRPRLAGLLLVTWTYLAFMSKEFFVRDWLKARPFTYLWTHMLIMPLIDFYATACDWLASGRSAPPGLFWFLIVSFFNGVVIEIGRKIRAPEDEEPGVQTYSVIWGRRNAVCAWLFALAITAASAGVAAAHIHFLAPVLCLLGLIVACAVINGTLFLRRPVAKAGKRFEAISGLWTLSLYLILGAIPMVIQVTRALK